MWLLADKDGAGFETIWLFQRKLRSLTRIAPEMVTPDRFVWQVRPLLITARDGLPLVAYLSTPNNQQCDSNNCPMVMLLHGGPRARDSYPANPEIAWLIERGYVVLTVNYRGSAGFGKKFEALNKGQWGLQMQDDVLDALQWAISHNIADPARVAVMGNSHGAFLALNAVTHAPDKFACAVAAGATPDLAAFVEKLVQQQPGLASDLYESVGDVRKLAVRDALYQRSAMANIEKVKARLLLAHGEKDRQAPFSAMQGYVARLLESQVQFAWLTFPDEAHGIGDGATRLAWYGIAEHFLADCLKGKKTQIVWPNQGGKIRVHHGPAIWPFLQPQTPTAQ
jgi:dipeptidyl aminopeptidase/acylaminoacyl peptidase